MESKTGILFCKKERDEHGIYCEQKLIPDVKHLPTITDKEIKEAIKNNTDTEYTSFEEKTDNDGHVTVMRIDRKVNEEKVIFENKTGPFQLVGDCEIPIIRNHKPCEKCCGEGSCQNAPVINGKNAKCCGKCKQHDLILP